MKLKACALVLLSPMLVCGPAHAQGAAASQGQPIRHKFTAGLTGRALPSGGALSAGYAEATAEDGTVVYSYEETYKSANGARDALDRLISRASRVIKQDTKKDPKRGAIGERVELLFSAKDKTSTQIVIAWTDGARLIRIRSKSLPLLLDFESQAYP